ncbi:MAG: DUF3459 domain-containing protein, partial [Bdellovibrionales bacterium]|nr:DUF3459 domain-containing protein [Bdellovibrionales bacterium]
TKGRRNEFRAFGWSGPVPDPAHEDTFARSKLTSPPTDSAISLLYKTALTLRRELPSLTPGSSCTRVAGADHRSLTLLRSSADGSTSFTLFNFSAESLEPFTFPADGEFRLLFDSTEAPYRTQAPFSRESAPASPWSAQLYVT